jgi:hypothetical protein
MLAGVIDENITGIFVAIFGTTSRGANLHGFIQKQNHFLQIINPQVVVKRGGSINQIHNDIALLHEII